MRTLWQVAPAVWMCFAFSSTEASAQSCDELTELRCIAAAECTLHQVADAGNGYVCKVAANMCEHGFKQKSGTRSDCESKTGCVFVPQSCYCAPDVICFCGGGPPSQCRPKS